MLEAVLVESGRASGDVYIPELLADDGTFFDSTRALSLLWRERLGELDQELVEELGDDPLTNSDPLSEWKPRISNGTAR